MKFQDKTALVTGAAGGIGKAIVARLQAGGATVLGADRVQGEADHFITGDLTDKAFCGRAACSGGRGDGRAGYPD